MWNKVPKNEYHKGKPGTKKNPYSKDKVVIDKKSELGYSDGSPYNNDPFIDINTPNGMIDMSNTGRALMANGRYLQPYSGLHQFDTNVVREQPIAQYGGDPSIEDLNQMKKGGWLDQYQSGGTAAIENRKYSTHNTDYDIPASNYVKVIQKSESSKTDPTGKELNDIQKKYIKQSADPLTGKFTVVDKGSNMVIYGTYDKKTGVIDYTRDEVLTGANYHLNVLPITKDPFSYDKEDNPDIKTGKGTPLGNFPTLKEDAYGNQAWDLVDGQRILLHQTAHSEHRDQLYGNMNPYDNYRSFGCVNCQRQTIENLKSIDPKQVTIIDSNLSIYWNDKYAKLNKYLISLPAKEAIPIAEKVEQNPYSFDINDKGVTFNLTDTRTYGELAKGANTITKQNKTQSAKAINPLANHALEFGIDIPQTSPTSPENLGATGNIISQIGRSQIPGQAINAPTSGKVIPKTITPKSLPDKPNAKKESKNDNISVPELIHIPGEGAFSNVGKVSNKYPVNGPIHFTSEEEYMSSLITPDKTPERRAAEFEWIHNKHAGKSDIKNTTSNNKVHIPFIKPPVTIPNKEVKSTTSTEVTESNPPAVDPTTYSIVEYLNSKGVSPSKENRMELAKAAGIDNYDYSAKQNLQLLKILENNPEILKMNTSKIATPIFKEGGWLDGYSKQTKLKGDRGFTSKNIKTSINDLMMRNEMLFGPSGKKRYKPKLQDGGWLDQYQGGGIHEPLYVQDGFNNYIPPGPVAEQSKNDNLGMTGMMKSKIATEAHYGNPAALRMVSPNPNKYTWTGKELDWEGNQASPAGYTGTHFMGSYGNQARPGLQEVDGKMQYFQNPPSNSKENFNFSTPEDAEYFAEHYKEVAPMMRNYEEYKDDGGLDTYQLGSSTYTPLSKSDSLVTDKTLHTAAFDTTKYGYEIEKTKPNKDDNVWKIDLQTGKKIAVPPYTWQPNKLAYQAAANKYAISQNKPITTPVFYTDFQYQQNNQIPIPASLQNKKLGGWLDQYQKGGIHEPLYVQDPNDPRLKAYSDSLNLYNMGSQNVADFNISINEAKNDWNNNMHWYTTSSPVAMYSRTVPISQVSQKDRPESINPLNYQSLNSTINPINYQKMGLTGDSKRNVEFNVPLYKKPVQPYVLDEPQTTASNFNSLASSMVTLGKPKPRYVPQTVKTNYQKSTPQQTNPIPATTNIPQTTQQATPVVTPQATQQTTPQVVQPTPDYKFRKQTTNFGQTYYWAKDAEGKWYQTGEIPRGTLPSEIEVVPWVNPMKKFGGPTNWLDQYQFGASTAAVVATKQVKPAPVKSAPITAATPATSYSWSPSGSTQVVNPTHATTTYQDAPHQDIVAESNQIAEAKKIQAAKDKITWEQSVGEHGQFLGALNYAAKKADDWSYSTKPGGAYEQFGKYLPDVAMAAFPLGEVIDPILSPAMRYGKVALNGLKSTLGTEIGVPTQLPGSPNNLIPQTPLNNTLRAPLGTIKDLERMALVEKYGLKTEGDFPLYQRKLDTDLIKYNSEMGTNLNVRYPNPTQADMFTGSTDIPQFNQEMQNFNTLMQFGKRPLETQIIARPETQNLLGQKAFIESTGDYPMHFNMYGTSYEMVPGLNLKRTKPLTGYQMFQQIQPNKYGGSPRKSDKKLVNYSQNPNFVKTSWLDQYQTGAQVPANSIFAPTPKLVTAPVTTTPTSNLVVGTKGPFIKSNGSDNVWDQVKQQWVAPQNSSGMTFLDKPQSTAPKSKIPTKVEEMAPTNPSFNALTTKPVAESTGVVKPTVGSINQGMDAASMSKLAPFVEAERRRQEATAQVRYRNQQQRANGTAPGLYDENTQVTNYLHQQDKQKETEDRAAVMMGGLALAPLALGIAGIPAVSTALATGFAAKGLYSIPNTYRNWVAAANPNSETTWEDALGTTTENALDFMGSGEAFKIGKEALAANKESRLLEEIAGSIKPYFSRDKVDLGNGLSIIHNPGGVNPETNLLGKSRPLKKIVNNDNNRDYMSLKSWTDKKTGKIYYNIEAVMPHTSPLRAGKAYHTLVLDHVPIGETILEKTSLSQDALFNILKQSKKPRFETSVVGTIPMNDLAVNKTIFKQNKAGKGVTDFFASPKKAKDAIAELNNLLEKHDLPLASLTRYEHPQFENRYMYGLTIPNIALKRLYSILGAGAAGTVLGMTNSSSQ